MESIWIRFLGIALLLIGFSLLLSPAIPYTRRQKIGSSQYSVKSERFFLIPRPAAAVIVAAGIGALILASRRARP